MNKALLPLVVAAQMVATPAQSTTYMGTTREQISQTLAVTHTSSAVEENVIFLSPCGWSNTTIPVGETVTFTASVPMAISIVADPNFQFSMSPGYHELAPGDKLTVKAMKPGSGGIGTECDAGNGDVILKSTGNKLAIELISFEATYDRLHNEIDLTWKTASESANEKFLIQSSRDGHDFQTIGERASNAPDGTTDGKNAYSFSIPHLRPGKLYVRIVDVDLQGIQTPHEMKSVTVPGGPDLQIAPNPVFDRLHAFVDTQKDPIIDARILSIDGKYIPLVLAVSDTDIEADVSAFAPGIYVLQLQTKNGRQITERFSIVK